METRPVTGTSSPFGRLTVLALLLVVAPSCDGSVETADGLYLGTDVSFRVADGVAYDFRFSHIECRVPHPVNEAVALCLLRPDGQPEDSLGLDGVVLRGDVGDVYLQGALKGVGATGTWSFEATCFDGTVCESAGEWTASWTDEPGGSQLPDPLEPPDPESPLGAGSPADSGAGEGRDQEGLGEPGEPAENATELQLTAWEAFEAVRGEAGLGMPAQDDALNAAAQAHADYFSMHAESYSDSGLNPHQENPDWDDGFTGVGIGERFSYHGVGAGGGGEVMAFTGSAQGAVNGWMATLYHRIPFVHPNTYLWGFGIAESGAKCEVMDYTQGPPIALGATTWSTDGKLGVPWPPPGATGVDTSWNGAESPQPPLPEGESYPSGPIITLSFVNGASLALTTATLTGPAGEVSSQVQTPDNDSMLSTTLAIYAYDPLASLTTYTVNVAGTVDGEPYEAAWTFATR
jgi:hypothetical protein